MPSGLDYYVEYLCKSSTLGIKKMNKKFILGGKIVPEQILCEKGGVGKVDRLIRNANFE